MNNFKHINVLIIDDEENSLELVSGIIKDEFSHINIHTANDVKSGIVKIKESKPDIVLLDIDMPDGTGFDLLQQLDSYQFKLIFITAHQEYAIKAIKFSALDYLLKPINALELTASINKAINLTDIESDQDKIITFISNFNNGLKKLVLNTAGNIYIIDVQDIIRCESENNYTVFYLKDERKIMMSKTLKEYDSLLANNNFIRIHRSHLININYIERIDKKSTGLVLMKDQSKVPLSARKKELLIQMLNKFCK